MRKYVYENAIVYITQPTEEQLENIRKVTVRFVHRLAKEGFLDNDKRRNNHRAGRTGFDAGKRNKEIKKADRSD